VPTEGRISEAVSVAVFCRSTTIRRAALMNAGSSCELRAPSSRLKRSCGQAVGIDSRKSATGAKRAVEAALVARLSSSEPSRRKASFAR